MAEHDTRHFDSIRTVTVAVDWFVERLFDTWIPARREGVSLELFYPVVVLQGELLVGTERAGKVVLRKSDHVRLRTSQIVERRERNHQIDVVTEAGLGKLLGQLNREGKLVEGLLLKHRVVVERSIDEILKLALKSRSRRLIRRALEYSGHFDRDR